MKKVVVTAALAALVLGAPAQAFTWKSLLFGSPDSVGLALDTSKGHLEAIMARCSKRNLTIAAAVTVVAAGAYWWWTKSKKTDASVARHVSGDDPAVSYLHAASPQEFGTNRSIGESGQTDHSLTYLDTPSSVQGYSSVTGHHIRQSRDAQPGSTQDSGGSGASASQLRLPPGQIFPESFLADRSPLTPERDLTADNEGADPDAFKTPERSEPASEALRSSLLVGQAHMHTPASQRTLELTACPVDGPAVLSPAVDTFGMSGHVLSPQTPQDVRQEEARMAQGKVEKVIKGFGESRGDVSLVGKFFTRQYNQRSKDRPFCLDHLQDHLLYTIGQRLAGNQEPCSSIDAEKIYWDYQYFLEKQVGD